MSREKKVNNWPWRFPEQGIPLDKLTPRLEEAKRLNIDYREDPVLGFPGTAVLPEVIEAVTQFLSANPNNITVHTTDKEGERGFRGTQQLEREAIYAIANLIGVENPPAEVDGYICSGGTGGNDHGMWLGREKLRQTIIPAGVRQGIVVMKSLFGHYSIDKNFGRLFDTGISVHDEESWERYANRLAILPTNHSGELTPGIVADAITQYFAEGYRRFLLVLTAGTVNLGSIDQIEAINARLVEMQKQCDHLRVYIHVDAAFGGFVIPFLEQEVRFGFQNSLVGSVSLDAHKMLYVPYPAGIFLCRKGDLEYTATVALYLEGGVDKTVCGSRPGAAAVTVWTAIRVLGREGCETRLKACMDVLWYLRKRLEELEVEKFYDIRLNVLAVRFPLAMAAVLKKADELATKKSFCIPTEWLPADFAIPAALRQNESVHEVHRFLATPTLTREHVDEFMNKVKQALLEAPQVTATLVSPNTNP